MDNASIHTARRVIEFINQRDIPVLFTGVASFYAIPVEMVFSHIKRRF